MFTSLGTPDPRPTRRLVSPVVGLTAAAVTAATLAGVSSPAQGAGPDAITVQMSVSTGGFAPGNGANNDGSTVERRLVSADGRYVVLAASGPVVPGQKPTEWQIVRRDRYLGTTTLISRSTAGEAGNARSGSPSISADGQVVAFHSYASNLVADDTNNQSDIFIHDVAAGTTVRASVNDAGQQVAAAGGTNPTGPPTLSADGRFVGFTSVVQGLAPGDATGANAYLHDRVAGTTEVVSRTASGAVVDAMTATTVSVSDGGRVVSFESGNASVVPGDSNSDPDVFVRDRVAGTTTKVPGGQEGSGSHAMSADGRFVAFVSASATLVPDDTNAKRDVFVWDRTLQTTSRVSVDSGGTAANGHSAHPGLSSDGRYVTFESEASNLVSGDTNGQVDVFRLDRGTGVTARVSVGPAGAQDQEARYASISGDGQHITFESYSRTLTAVDTKGYGQVFVRDLAGAWPALHARVGTLPGRVNRDTDHTVSALDIRTGPDLVVTWTPKRAKAKVVRQNVPVRADAFTLRSPTASGTYDVTVHYADNLVGQRSITVLRPSAKKLPSALKVRKKLKVRTVGVGAGQKIRVQFAPVKGTKGKVAKRKATVNRKGVAMVQPPRTRGTYRVTVRLKGAVLRSAVVRIR